VKFLIKKLDVLDHTIEQGVIKPSQRHVDSILRMGPQKTKQGVRALLGVTQYHSNMIPNLAEITRDLSELLKRNVPDKNFPWAAKHSYTLQQIKNLLSKPVLAAPKFDRGFIFMCDPTQFTIVLILSRADDDPVERNIGYYSRKLIPREIKFSVIETECLAVLASVLHWHQWMWGYPVQERTDHSSLRY
jgi:hypothetical protein